MPAELESLVVSISADTRQIQRSLERLLKDSQSTAKGVEAAFDNVVPFDKASQNFNRGARAMAADAKNLQFQLNDLFTQIQSGTGFAQAFGTQAGQISQVLSGAGGIRGAASLAGTALAGMLNPLYAIPLAVSVALPALMNYFAEAEEGGEDAEKALKTQRELIREVAREWGAALPALAAHNKALEAQEEIAKRIAGQQAAIESQQGKAREAMAGVNAQMENALNLFTRTPAMAQKLAPVITAWETLKKRIEDGTATLKEVDEFQRLFNQSVAGLPLQSARNFARTFNSEVAPAIGAAVAEMNRLSEEQRAVNEKLRDTQTLIQQMRLAPLGQTTLDVTPVYADAGKFFPSQAEMEQAGEERGRAFSSGLRKYLAADKPLSHVADMAPEFQERLRAFLEAAAATVGDITITSGRRTIERQMQLWNAAVKKYGSPEAAGKWVARPSPNAPHVRGEAADLAFQSEAVKQWAHANAEAYGLVFRLKNESWHIELAQEGRRKREKRTLDDLMLSEREQIELQRRVNAINADATLNDEQRLFAIDKLVAETKLLNEAKREGLPVDAAARAQIEATATSQAQAAARERELTAAKKEGVEATRRKTEAERQAQQVTQQLVSTGLSSLVSELRQGASAADALNSALNAVLDTLIQMTIQSLSSNLGKAFPFPFATAHGGGVVGAMGARRNVNPLVFAGAPRMHNGGLVPGEVPIIAKRGEIILPNAKAMAGRSTVDNSTVNLGDVEINVPNGVAATSKQAKELGLLIDKSVQGIIVRESRPGGLLRRPG